MMDVYIEPIKQAIIFFPIIAFIITLPYMFFQYRKYGSINRLRTLIIYSFILYLTVAYFLIILPLPSIEDVANLISPRVQLQPFNFITDFINHTSLDITNPHTYLIALREPVIYQVLYNIVLLIPLGIYLRYYFNLNIFKTILISFLVSLFFELTQLTGLYFIYPRSYRLFDVDDLIINTLGGMLGFLLTPLLTFFLPTREEIDELSYLEGQNVSFLRRLFAYIIDQTIILFIVSIINFNVNEYLLVFFIYYMLIPIKTKGETLGKKLLKIRITNINGEDCKWYQYTFRYLLQYITFFLIPKVLLYGFTWSHGSNNYIILLIIAIISLVYFGYIFIKLCFLLFSNKMLDYERISKTINSSTIKLIEKESDA